MEPIFHLYHAHIFIVGYVQEILVLLDYVVLNLAEFGLLTVQEEVLLVCQVEEGVVAGDDCPRITWEMRPKFLIIRSQHSLINSLLNNRPLYQGGKGQKHEQA